MKKTISCIQVERTQRELEVQLEADRVAKDCALKAKLTKVSSCSIFSSHLWLAMERVNLFDKIGIFIAFSAVYPYPAYFVNNKCVTTPN